MSGGGRTALVLLCALLVLLSSAVRLASPAEQAEVLGDEDVVRMFVAGRPLAEILEAIRTSAVEFDLSKEMTDELRAAGLPEELVQAMRERQAELERERAQAAGEPPPVPQEPEADLPQLRVRLQPPEPEDPEEPAGGLVYPAVLLDDNLAKEYGLGFNRDNWTVSELAVFFACRTADHVPDQWRSKSPLGRDFVRMPRHRMLAFHAGADRVSSTMKKLAYRQLAGSLPSGESLEFLQLELPAELSAEVEPDTAHDLLLGFAARIADRYVVLAVAQSDGVVVESGGRELQGTVWSRIGVRGLSVGAKFLAPSGG